MLPAARLTLLASAAATKARNWRSVTCARGDLRGVLAGMWCVAAEVRTL